MSKIFHQIIGTMIAGLTFIATLDNIIIRETVEEHPQQ